MGNAFIKYTATSFFIMYDNWTNLNIAGLTSEHNDPRTYKECSTGLGHGSNVKNTSYLFKSMMQHAIESLPLPIYNKKWFYKQNPLIACT